LAQATPGAAALCRRLLETALAHHSDDNISAIVVDILKFSPAPAAHTINRLWPYFSRWFYGHPGK
jgi:hypothetical protein